MRRVTCQKVSKSDLVQADFLLFFRTFLAEAKERSQWYPQCIGYLSQEGTLEVFGKATSTRGFEAVRHLMGVKTLAELYEKIQAAIKNQQLTQLLHSERFMRLDFKELFNLGEIVAKLGQQK